LKVLAFEHLGFLVLTRLYANVQTVQQSAYTMQI